MKHLKYWFITIFFIGLLSRIYLIEMYARRVPVEDQWHVIIMGILKPMVHGTYRFKDIFTPFCEHRLVYNNFYDWMLFSVFGTFNNVRECIFNSIEYLTFLSLFFWFLIKKTGIVWPLVIICAIFSILPISQENTIIGFQFQAYLVIAFILVSSCLYANNNINTGALVSFLGIGAMAHGSVASFSFLALLMLDYLSGTRGNIKCIPPLIVIGLAVWLNIPMPALEYQHYAHSFIEFFCMSIRYIAWPCIYYPWAVVIVCFPCTYLLIKRLRGNTLNTFTERLSLILFFISLAQAIMIGHNRANMGTIFIERYQDFFIVSILAEALAVYELGIKEISYSYVCAAFIGIGTLTEQSINNHTYWKVQNHNSTVITEAFYIMANNPKIKSNMEIPIPFVFDKKEDVMDTFRDTNVMSCIPSLYKHELINLK